MKENQEEMGKAGSAKSMMNSERKGQARFFRHIGLENLITNGKCEEMLGRGRWRGKTLGSFAFSLNTKRVTLMISVIKDYWTWKNMMNNAAGQGTWG